MEMSNIMTLEQAIEKVIAIVPQTPLEWGESDFRSVESLTAACDPNVRGVRGAAMSRALVRKGATGIASQGEWDATSEEVRAELDELASLGFRWTCANGVCSITTTPQPSNTEE